MYSLVNNDFLENTTMQEPIYWTTSTINAASKSGTYEIVKRAIDIMLAGIALLLLIPIFIPLAIVIKLDSAGPVLFGQARIGKSGKPFKCWKFRSMVSDAEQKKRSLSKCNEVIDGPTFKIRKDPRITNIGSWIRKASVDELPQLWNVFIGDMTLVGPRPPVPQEVAQYTALERRRLAVVPGITCLWQVSGRSELPFKEQVRLDIRYIETRNLRQDFWILLRTIPAVISGRGAY